MNRDQVKGVAKNVAGKVQRWVGELTGNKSQQVKGAAKQVEGKVTKGVGVRGDGADAQIADEIKQRQIALAVRYVRVLRAR